MRTWSVVAAMCLIVAVSLSASEPPVFIYVDDDAAPGGNGSPNQPFSNLPDAVAAGRMAAGFVTIRVAPGDYPLTETLVIDRPVDLRGSTEPFDDMDSWPTGAAVSGTASRIFAATPALTRLIVAGRDDGAIVRTVSIRGFVIEGTPAGPSVLLNRVQGYWIADNIFSAPATFGVQSVASSGRISHNHFSGLGTGAMLAGGYAESPSEVLFDDNRAVNNAGGALLLGGASIGIPEPGDELNAVVRDNDLSNNTGSQGYGLRAFILSRDSTAPDTSQSFGNVYADVVGNRVVGNRVGIYLDAGFPYRRVNGLCDGRTYSGTMNLRFVRNTLSGSTLAGSILTFTRNVAALNQALLPQSQYLKGAVFMISDRDGILTDAWIDHPAADPFLGPCPGDATHEVLGNVLIYNGQVLPYGRNF